MNNIIAWLKNQFFQEMPTTTGGTATKIKPTMIGYSIVGLLLLLIFFGEGLKKIFKPARRRIRHRRPAQITRRRRRTLPRSVGIRKQYTKGGKAKKPWQIKGSEAARRHMRKIRAMR